MPSDLRSPTAAKPDTASVTAPVFAVSMKNEKPLPVDVARDCRRWSERDRGSCAAYVRGSHEWRNQRQQLPVGCVLGLPPPRQLRRCASWRSSAD